MALTKSQRIQILLVIDGLFFFLELITGYAVHSLALVADSFHMLNDVFSLFIALWAVRAADRKSNTTYTYGWQRAETLGALINGVFLVALCATIFIEAVQRFVQIEEVTNPQIILIVGACGLASNLCGLFLFHDHSHGGHGHSHGGHSHSHGEAGHKHSDELGAAEEGCGTGHMRDSTDEMADETGNPIGALPQVQTGAWSSTNEPPTSRNIRIETPDNKHSSDRASGSTLVHHSTSSHRRARSSGSRGRAHSGVDDLPINQLHPASFRASIILEGQREHEESEPNSDEERDLNESGQTLTAADEHTPLIGNGKKADGHGKHSSSISNHAAHKHAQPKDAAKSGGHGHSHSDLNMRGVFLHVMGDALGNVGVIVTALFIWKTNYWWRFYCDPLISLIITVIILCSAIPLCKAAGRILLQGVPAGVNISDLKEDILSIKDISSCHHLHVWQLSDTKLIASLHVRVNFEFEGEGSQRYMAVAREIRRCLHEYGIHISTIQPEFCCERVHGHKMILSREGTDDEGAGEEEAAHAEEGENGCLLDCDDDCGDGGKCCDPVVPAEAGGNKK